MNKKLSIFFLFFILIIFLIFCTPKDNEIYIKKVISPNEFILENGESFKFDDFKTFDTKFSENNKNLAKQFDLTEEETFILGNLAKYWAQNLLEGRKVKIKNNEIYFLRFNYKSKFENTPFCIKNNKLTNQKALERQIEYIRKSNYKVLKDDKYYEISDAKNLDDFLVIRRRSKYKDKENNKRNNLLPNSNKFHTLVLKNANIKIIFSDLTTKTKPDRNCSSEVCKELLSNINLATQTIDMAIYGYSSTPVIENAIKNAIKRGVKVRLVYDLDSKGNNIYPDTNKFIKLIDNKMSDINSKEANLTMHNKFYIFDDKITVTGSANLSHTDMSGFNSNSIIVINSNEVAKIYKQEFEQMFAGNFHNSKSRTQNNKFQNLEIYFSPQDKGIKNGILPLIKNAKKYIYIPTFVITERNIVSELINAKQRGVDVRIIVDALNASNKSSKHQELRSNGILVKTENYAGKMHSKSVIIDDEYLVIGSMNLSYSGENKNDENFVIIKNPQATKFYKEYFLYQWNKIPNKWLKLNARAEGIDSIGSCSDGIDNDYDGLIDMNDEGCKKY